MVYKSQLAGPLPVHRLPGEPKLLGPVQADELGQYHHRAHLRHYARLDEVTVELGVLRGEYDVAAQREAHPPADGVAAHYGQHRLFHGQYRLHYTVIAGEHGAPLVYRVAALRGHFQVGAGAEVLSAALYYHDADVVVRIGAQQPGVELVHHVRVQGVAPLRLVEDHFDYAVAVFVADNFTHIRHTVTLYSRPLCIRPLWRRPCAWARCSRPL